MYEIQSFIVRTTIIGKQSVALDTLQSRSNFKFSLLFQKLESMVQNVLDAARK
jgi:hypothetical protein